MFRLIVRYRCYRLVVDSCASAAGFSSYDDRFLVPRPGAHARMDARNQRIKRSDGWWITRCGSRSWSRRALRTIGPGISSSSTRVRRTITCSPLPRAPRRLSRWPRRRCVRIRSHGRRAWPDPDPTGRPLDTDPLPAADVLVVTYTLAEGHALADHASSTASRFTLDSCSLRRAVLRQHRQSVAEWDTRCGGPDRLQRGQNSCRCRRSRSARGVR